MSTATPSRSPNNRERSFCSLCGSPLAPDQEWCLECGAARTIIRGAPDWRIPALVVGTVVAILAGLLILVLTELGHNAGELTLVTTTSASRAPTVSSWPPGLDGYTVVLASAPTEAAADRRAAQLIAGGLHDLGVLSTTQHPQMHPQGVWEVFLGRYPSYARAAAAARRDAHRRGASLAAPALVQRPGQG